MYGILAQLVEHLTFNQVVGGSNPPCLIKKGIMRLHGTFFNEKVVRTACEGKQFE